MKIVQVIDFLCEKMVQIEAPENETLVSQEKILLKNEGDVLVAKVVSGARELSGAKIDETYTFHKKLTQAEFQKHEEANKDSFERVKKAREIAEKLNLPMHFFASRSSFDKKVISFFFTAEQNVDFRELVKDLAKKFKKRIHLQRVNAQDRARIVGGVGGCGRVECCQFLKFTPERATMDAVRDQGIMVKHNGRIYGVSGRVKDCFMYEQDMYRAKRKYLPHIKQKVTVNGRVGRVKGLDILNGKVKVLFEEDIQDIFDISVVQYDNKIPEPKEQITAEPFVPVDMDGVGF